MFHVEQITQPDIELCPACTSTEHVMYLKLDDYFLSKESFSLKKCTQCGLLHTVPQPDIEQLGRYYQSSDYISHSTDNKSFMNVVYDIIRRSTLRSKLALIKKYSEGTNLLDIGCATGVFLNYCQSQGYNVKGIEPEAKPREFAINEYKLDVGNLDYLSSIKNQSIDIVTMWHVLEHVSDIKERMQVIHKILKDSGTAFIALPNPQSYDAQYYKNYWAAYDVPRHLYHFTQKSFHSLAAQHSFKVIATIPMLYDAFYISLLSEKYKNSKLPYLKAIIKGLQSNIYASRNDNNYSSLIYIIRKS